MWILLVIAWAFVLSAGVALAIGRWLKDLHDHD